MLCHKLLALMLTHTHTCLQMCDKTVTMTFTFDLAAVLLFLCLPPGGAVAL